MGDAVQCLPDHFRPFNRPRDLQSGRGICLQRGSMGTIPGVEVAPGPLVTVKWLLALPGLNKGSFTGRIRASVPHAKTRYTGILPSPTDALTRPPWHFPPRGLSTPFAQRCALVR